MQRFVIITVNCAWLALLLVGIPAVTQAQFGDWQISSGSDARLLMFGGLTIAAVTNAVIALTFAKSRKQKILWWEWAAVFGALIFAEYAFARGYFNFDWLKKILLWLQNHF